VPVGMETEERPYLMGRVAAAIKVRFFFLLLSNLLFYISDSKHILQRETGREACKGLFQVRVWVVVPSD
jgi:hypothetical protein